MSKYPKGYEWLGTLGTLPMTIQKALELVGTVETPGKANNPIIMGWADEVGVAKLGYKYTGDDVPWCGLFAAVVSQRAGKPLPYGPLYSLNWGNVGTAVKQPVLGDVLTFTRSGGGHVGFYVAEDDTAYHVLGGNQSDKVSIARVAKDRLYRARRPAFKTALPASAKAYRVKAAGGLSQNEA